jgi:predicted phage-related endonuclease
MFTASQRAGYLGASDAPFFMNGDKTPQQLLAWWEVKVGISEMDPPTYAMRLGSLVGDFVVDEYQLQCGEPITRRQELVTSPDNSRLRSTLDGFNSARNAVIEAKFASPFFDRDQIFQTYYAQVAMQMHCTDAKCGFLVIAQGTNEPIEIECIRDARYEAMLLNRAEAMLECMDTMTPPVAIDTPVMVPPEKWRTVDLAIDQPNWADEMLSLLHVFDQTQQVADQHDELGKLAKELVPDDVGRVLAQNHIIARNKKGTLVLTRRKS